MFRSEIYSFTDLHCGPTNNNTGQDLMDLILLAGYRDTTYSNKLCNFLIQISSIATKSKSVQIFCLVKVSKLTFPNCLMHRVYFDWSTFIVEKIIWKQNRKKNKWLRMRRKGKISKMVQQEWKIERKDENRSKQVCKKKIGGEEEKIKCIYYKFIHKKHMHPVRITHSACWQFTTIQHRASIILFQFAKSRCQDKRCWCMVSIFPYSQGDHYQHR